MLSLDDQKENGVSVCMLRGRLDGNTSEQADRHLHEREQKEATGDLILDLSELDYLSSAGLRIFLMSAKRAKSQNRQIVLAAPNENVQQVLTISGFSSILQIFPDRTAAAEALAQ